MGGSVAAEVRGDFESIDRPCRREVRRPRSNEGGRGHLMGKWVRAGVRDHGERTHPATGVVPGGGLAPVRAQLGLHQVLEAWCARDSPGCRDAAS